MSRKIDTTEYIPRAKDKRAGYVAWGAMLLALVMVITDAATTRFSWAFQLVFIISAVVAVYVWIRYLYAVYAYSVTAEFGSPRLLVMRHYGKRSSTMFEIKLGDITSVKKHEGGLGITARRTKRYNYCTTLRTSTCIRILVSEGGGFTEVLLEWDDEFYRALTEAVATAKVERAAGNL